MLGDQRLGSSPLSGPRQTRSHPSLVRIVKNRKGLGKTPSLLAENPGFRPHPTAQDPADQSPALPHPLGLTGL